ncbi:hypothetical protein ACOMHN_000232 [Nucella lapillus]
MTLYTEPPTGSISFQKLESFAMKRLDFLLKVRAARGDLSKLHEIVCEPENVTDSDCLIVGSLKDKVSHFILRLLMGGDPETQQFFREAETAWFDFKLSCMTEDEMNKFFGSVDKILKKTVACSQSCQVFPGSANIAGILGVFKSIKQSVGSWKEVVRLYLAQCPSSQFSVPFHRVLNLVKGRQVVLDRGMARVPFSRLREVVTEQFLSLMWGASAQASQQFPAAVADERLRLLWRKMKNLHRKHTVALPKGVGLVPGLSLDQVDSMAVHYPLCMASLLRSLRHKHRLGHHARIQLTLFLKDLGLPVHHAVALWQQEYSRPPRGIRTSCTHSWQSDGRRYTYSIRHLYGLEGARQSYQGHCCQSLQQRAVGCGEEGGCPFSHWDQNALSAELSSLGVHAKEIGTILSLQGAGLFSAACYCSLRTATSGKATVTRLTGRVHRGLHTTSGRTNVTRLTRSVHNDKSDQLAVKAPACHQVTISPSPEGMYREDCSGNQVCDVEDLVEPSRGKSVERTARLASVRQRGPGVTVTEAEQRPFATDNACDTSGLGVTVTEAEQRPFATENACDTSGLGVTVAEEKPSVILCATENASDSSGLGVTVTGVEHQLFATEHACDSSHHCVTEGDVCGHTTSLQFSPKLDRCPPSTDETLSCVETSEKCLQVPKDHDRGETESQRARCFDHEVCPSQSQDVGDPASSMKDSDYPVIYRPAHYVQVSYQHLLEGLKSS